MYIQKCTVCIVNLTLNNDKTVLDNVIGALNDLNKSLCNVNTTRL